MAIKILKKIRQYVDDLKKSDFLSRYGGMLFGIIVALGIGAIIYSRQYTAIAPNNFAQIPPWFSAGQTTTRHTLIPEQRLMNRATPFLVDDFKNANYYQSQEKNALLQFGKSPIQEGALSVNDFSAKAEKGEGVTHLARHALAQYLKSAKPAISLSKEHKIYIEDYLRRTSKKDHLRVGEELTFLRKTIEQAIRKAQQLGEGQLHKLTQYANRVPSLNPYP